MSQEKRCNPFGVWDIRKSSVFFGLHSFLIVRVGAETYQTNKCDIPPTAPKRIENVINQCQDEIKIAILSEALKPQCQRT
ncbi:hypothetical protein JTB14_030005 [Gonioctena quinquepunctata]|nr:hypothetical protein JTB14_030005 [Gonioctena quinquepunctata]